MTDNKSISIAKHLASIISNQALIIGDLNELIDEKDGKINFLEEKLLKETGEKIE